MTPTEKISKRILFLESLCAPHYKYYEDFWNRETRSWHRVDRSDLFPALAKITDTCPTTNLDWLKEKADEIDRKGMLWLMDYLDQENLDRLLDPSFDLFPAAGI